MPEKPLAMFARWRPEKADGVSQAVCHLARALAVLGQGVEIWEPRRGGALVPRRVLEPGIAVTGIPLSAGGFRVPKAARAFLREASAGCLGVQFHSSYVPANVAVAPLLRCPYAVTPHGGYTYRRMRNRSFFKKWIFFRLLSRSYLERAAFVHVLTPAEEQGLREICHPRRVVIAPNGCSLPPELAALVAPAPRPPGERHLLCLGRLDIETKGLDRVLQAFASIRSGSDRLALAGPDFRGSRARLLAMVRQLGLAESVDMPGALEGSAKWAALVDADTVVQFSRTEGLPLAPIEGMALGRPAAVSEESNLGPWVTAHEAGWLAGNGDFSSALAECLRAPAEELARRGQNARRLVREEFRWEHTAARLLSAFEESAAP